MRTIDACALILFNLKEAYYVLSCLDFDCFAHSFNIHVS